MVGMPPKLLGLNGVWGANAEIPSRGSTGNLLIWMAWNSDFLLIGEKIVLQRAKKITTLRVMTFFETPRAGFEPATNRLTVDRSTAELPRIETRRP
jgi:hypothetical protein